MPDGSDHSHPGKQILSHIAVLGQTEANMQNETDSSARAIERPPFATPSKYFDTPLRLLVLVIASVFIAEAMVMLLFTSCADVRCSDLHDALSSSLFSPALYVFLLRPLSRQIEAPAWRSAASSAGVETQWTALRIHDREPELQDGILERQQVEECARARQI
jgi:hypothetical protein